MEPGSLRGDAVQQRKRSCRSPGAITCTHRCSHMWSGGRRWALPMRRQAKPFGCGLGGSTNWTEQPTVQKSPNWPALSATGHNPSSPPTSTCWSCFLHVPAASAIINSRQVFDYTPKHHDDQGVHREGSNSGDYRRGL